MEVEHTYQHNKTRAVVRVIAKHPNGYEVMFPYCDMNAMRLQPCEMYMTFLLLNEYVGNYHEVVVDSDGLVYQTTPIKGD